MLLYWGLFTIGFIVGVSLTLLVFRQIIFSKQAQEIEESTLHLEEL